MKIGEILKNSNNTIIIKNRDIKNKNEMDLDVKRGDVFYAKLYGENNIQRGIRPVLIFGNDIGNRYAPIVTVIPLTSKINKKLPVHVIVQTDFLKMKSVALCEQITTISKLALLQKMGTMNEIDMSEVEKGVKTQCGFLH